MINKAAAKRTAILLPIFVGFLLFVVFLVIVLIVVVVGKIVVVLVILIVELDLGRLDASDFKQRATFFWPLRSSFPGLGPGPDA